MRMINKIEFLKRCVVTIDEIFDMLVQLPPVKLNDLDGQKTALIIVDMVNGFAREGALQSPRVEGLILDISRLSRACDELKIAKLAFADNHTDASPEFEAYPPHCLTGTTEGEIVEELKEIGGYTLIPKNSTNGFLENKFQKWLRENEHIDNLVITGDCTDICIQQFATTLKTWFNMQNRKSRIIVPINTVDTYDLGLHEAELMSVMALYNMTLNGVEVVAEVELDG